MDDKTPQLPVYNILAVDDDPNLCKIITATLTDHANYNVDSAADGIEAFEKYRKAVSLNQPYDLMIVDLKMPRMNGETLICEIHKENRDIALIVFTGHGSLSEAFALLEKYQISDFLYKPLVHPRALLFSVKNALEKRLLKQQQQKYSELLEKRVKELS